LGFLQIFEVMIISLALFAWLVSRRTVAFNFPTFSNRFALSR
jgi:hypothetical protein